MTEQLINNEILYDIIPRIAQKYKYDADLKNEIEDFKQNLYLFYLKKQKQGKFSGKEKGDVITAIKNHAISLLRKRKKVDDFNKFVEDADQRSNNLQILENLQTEDLKNSNIKKKGDIQLIPDWLPFQSWGNYIGGLQRPIFPEYYQNKIWMSDRIYVKRIKTYPPGENLANDIAELTYSSVKMYERMGVCKPLSVKKLFWRNLEIYSKQDHNDWYRANWFTYHGTMVSFCKTYKYNGWYNLKKIVSMFRKETNILGEYFYINEIISTVKSLYQNGIKGTINSICNKLSVKPNQGKVLFYLGSQVVAQKIKYKYDEDIKAGVFLPFET